MCQPDVGDICSPHLARSRDHYAAQQVRIDLVLRVRAAGVGAWRHTCRPQYAHQPLQALAINPVASCLQKRSHLAAAIKWPAGELLFNQAQQFQVQITSRPGRALCIDRCSLFASQLTLANHRQCSLRLNQGLACFYWHNPDFF